MSSPIVIGTLAFLLFFTSLFMILLVLIQRGRGGGLAGAFGGMGGQSAFGTRAGDVFTKITVIVAIVFILLASLLGKGMRSYQKDVDLGIVGPYEGGANVEPEESGSDDNAAPVLDAVGEGDSMDSAENSDLDEDNSGDTTDATTDDEAVPESDDPITH